jgi:hypothetical protein
MSYIVEEILSNLSRMWSLYIGVEFNVGNFGEDGSLVHNKYQKYSPINFIRWA